MKKLFGLKQKTIPIMLSAIGGKICPVCNNHGLFSYPDCFICEECLSVFDKEMKKIIK